MLEFDIIDISKVNDVNETSASKECDICHYWYEPYLCNGFHDLMQKDTSFNDVKGSAYRFHFWYISKDDAISIMNNSNLIDKKAVL